MDEGIFFAEEDVLCDGQSGQSSHFLHDDRDAETVRADLVLDEDRLVFQGKCTAAKGIDAGQHVGKGRFSGSVLADQRVDLMAVEIDRYMINSMCDTELFVDIRCSEQYLVVCHNAHPPLT